VRERILILLLQNDGKTQQEIAKFLGCSARTVAYYVHGDPDHLESLHNKREQEHYRKATPKYLTLLLETEKNQRLGYEFGRWTGERLATYLAEQTGIQFSNQEDIKAKSIVTFGQSTVWRISKIQLIELNLPKKYSVFSYY